MRFSTSVLLLVALSSLLTAIESFEYGYSTDSTARAVRELGKYIRQRAMVYEDASQLSVFYSLTNNQTINEMMPRPWYRPGQSLRLPFIGEPCSCSGLQCGCCAGIKITQFNIDRRACANITYDQSNFAMNLDVFLNDQNVLHQSLSARNPPPVCIPVPIGGIPGINFCIKLFDISTQGMNLHVCVDFEIRITSAPVLVLNFDCIRMGTDGVSLEKPGQGDSQQAPLPSESPDQQETASSPQTGDDTYDEVTEIKKDLSTSSPLPFTQSDNRTVNEPVNINI